MLHENLKQLRKAKGLSQEELAEKLHVVRQTISKWEQGLSVPDAELLIQLAEALDTSVGVLLGEPVTPEQPSELREIAAKLEQLNEQFARQQDRKRKGWRCFFAVLGILALCALVLELLPLFGQQTISSALHQDIGIIGGADGPTSILVSSSGPSALYFVTIFAVLAISLIGLFRTGRK